MKRNIYGRDRGLTLRMFATTTMLGLLYVLFAVVLFSVLNVGFVPLLVIVFGIAFFQYFTSDKLALRAAGAKVIERADAPQLFDTIERLARDGRAADAARRHRRHRRPQRVRHRTEPQARGRRSDHRADAPAR